MIHKLSLLALLYFNCYPIQNEGGIDWLSIEEVQAKMESEPKDVFIDIVADWCKWCKVMDKNTFADQEVISFVSNNYYAVRLDYESVEEIDFLGKKLVAKDLAQSWGVQDLPTVVFWKKGFEEKFLSKGYQDQKQFLETLQLFNSL